MSIALDSSSVIPSAARQRESSRIGIKGYGSFLDSLDRTITKYEERVALRIKEGDTWHEASYGSLREDARRVSSWLIDNGVVRGSIIALVSESRPEWCVALLAGMMSGATVVPIDAKLTAEEIAVLLDHAAPQLVFTSRAMESTVRTACADLGSVQGLIAIDGAAADAGTITFATIRASCPIRTHAPRRRDRNETALIVYTSGTTGSPKGVETTFGNLQFEMEAMDAAIGPAAEERFLSVLPLNHLYELICGLLTPLRRGASISYSDSLLPDDVVKILREERITCLVGVPLLFRALKRGIERTVRQRGRLTETWFARTMDMARFVPVSMRRAMFAPVLKSFGPDLRVFYSGGAALDMDVATFFERMGIPVYQGYGLSETSPVIATNSATAHRAGSVGRALDGVEIKIAKKNDSDETGEIMTRGPHVMAGYLRRHDLTREMIDDEGWLRTGDLGRIDEDGYLFVTGRSKDLIVLGGGKKVHPDEVEDVLGKSPLFKEVCVVGAPSVSAMSKGFDEVCAVIVPDDALALRLQSGALTDEDLEAEIKSEVARASKRLAAFKRPTRILVRHDALPKTATRKLKRPLVLQWITSGVERTK